MSKTERIDRMGGIAGSSALPLEATRLLDMALQHNKLMQRQHALKGSLNVLTEEGLPHLPAYLSKLETMQEHIGEIEREIQNTWGKVASNLSKDMWLSLISELDDLTKQPITQALIHLMEDATKELFYHAVRSDGELTGDDAHLVQRFEQKIGYSFSFAKKEWLGETEDELAPFTAFFERYLDHYHPQLTTTITWLRRTVFPMKLHESLHRRYAETMVRRLEIGEKEANEHVQKDIQEKATKELAKLIQQQQQKKSS